MCARDLIVDAVQCGCLHARDDAVCVVGVVHRGALQGRVHAILLLMLWGDVCACVLYVCRLTMLLLTCTHCPTHTHTPLLTHSQHKLVCEVALHLTTGTQRCNVGSASLVCAATNFSQFCCMKLHGPAKAVSAHCKGARRCTPWIGPAHTAPSAQSDNTSLAHQALSQKTPASPGLAR